MENLLLICLVILCLQAIRFCVTQILLIIAIIVT